MFFLYSAIKYQKWCYGVATPILVNRAWPFEQNIIPAQLQRRYKHIITFEIMFMFYLYSLPDDTPVVQVNTQIVMQGASVHDTMHTSESDNLPIVNGLSAECIKVRPFHQKILFSTIHKFTTINIVRLYRSMSSVKSTNKHHKQWTPLTTVKKHGPMYKINANRRICERIVRVRVILHVHVECRT